MDRDIAPLSPKRPRTDYSTPHNNCGKIHFDFPKLVTSDIKDCRTPPLNILLQQNTERVEFDHEYVRHTENTDEASVPERGAGAHVVSVNSVDRDLLQDELQDAHRPPSETDVSHIGVDGGTSTKLYASGDSKSDASSSSSHGFCQLGKSAGCTLDDCPSANKASSEQNSDSQIPRSNFRPRESEGTAHPDNGHENMNLDAGTYGTTRGFFEEDNQTRNFEEGFSQTVCSDREPGRYIYLSDNNRDCESSVSGNFAGVRSSDGDAARWENDVKGNVNVPDAITKARDNRDDRSDGRTSAAETARCVDCSIVTHNVEWQSHLPSNQAEINQGFMTDDLHQVTWGRAVADDMAAEAQSKPEDCRTTETSLSSAGREPAEGAGGIGLGLASVIDPATSSQGDREAEEKDGNFDWTSGVGSSPSDGGDFAISHPLPEYGPLGPSDLAVQNLPSVQQPGHSEEQDGTEHGDASQSTCQSSTEPHCCTTEEHDTGDESPGPLERRAPCSGPPGPVESCDAAEGSEVDSDPAGHPCGEHTRSPAGQVPTSPDLLKAGEVQSSPSTSECAAPNGITDGGGNGGKAMKTELHVDSVRSELAGKAQEDDMPNGSLAIARTPTRAWISDWAERQFTPARHLPVEPAPGDEAARDDQSADYYRETLEIEMLMFENEDIFSLKLPSDAVVPAPYSTPGCDEDDSAARPSGRERSTVPSALILPSDCVLLGFDRFEKIQLSLEDGDIGGLELSPLLRSSPIQAFNSELQVSDGFPEAERSDDKEISEKGEEGECQEEAVGHFYCCASSNVAPDFTSQRVPSPVNCPEQPGRSSPDSSYQFDSYPQPKLVTLTTVEDDQTSKSHGFPTFEMKEAFDLVIEELSIYFEISRETSVSAGGATSGLRSRRKPSADEEGNTSYSPFSDCPSSAAAEPHGDTSTRDDEDALKTYGAEPETACTTGNLDGQQEVPVDCSLLPEGETSMYPAVKQKESRQTEKKRWNPAFMSHLCMGQLNQSQPEHSTRLEPLKTCTRPIRVGLSKKAKTKQLHPYFK